MNKSTANTNKKESKDKEEKEESCVDKTNSNSPKKIQVMLKKWTYDDNENIKNKKHCSQKSTSEGEEVQQQFNNNEVQPTTIAPEHKEEHKNLGLSRNAGAVIRKDDSVGNVESILYPLNNNICNNKPPITTCNTHCTPLNYKDIHSINLFLKSVIKDYNEHNKIKVVEILQHLLIEDNSEMYIFLNTVNELTKTPYFYFVSEALRSFLLKGLQLNCKFSKELKIFSFEILLQNFDAVELLMSLIGLYSSIDSLKVSKSSFRNFCILQCFSKAIAKDIQTIKNNKSCMEDVEEINNKMEEKIFPIEKDAKVNVRGTRRPNCTKRKKKDGKDSIESTVTVNHSIKSNDKHNKAQGISKKTAMKNNAVKDKINKITELTVTTVCIQSLCHCIPFVEYLTRNTDIPTCRYLLIFICYDFLKGIKVDLLSRKLQDVPKNLDDSVISKVFLSFELLKKCFDNEEDKNGNVSHSTLTTLEVSSTPNGSSLIMLEDLQNTIKLLFNCSSIRTIILSIYKRLFFYFLCKNKKVFFTLKIFNIFSKEEKIFIYKSIKNNRISFINIFKQIQQQYLIKEAYKQNFINLSIISSIKQDKLEDKQLSLFYSLCFSYVIKHKESLKIKVLFPILFSQQFNSHLNRNFIKHLEIQWTSPLDYSSIELLKFLEYCTRSKENSKDIVDIIAVVSLLIDNPNDLFIKSKVVKYELLIRIIINVIHLLSVPLVKRLVPVLRRLILYREYTLYASRLYHCIYIVFKMEDPIFTSDTTLGNKDNIDIMLSIKGCLNHKSFEDTFQRLFSSFVCTTTKVNIGKHLDCASDTSPENNANELKPVTFGILHGTSPDKNVLGNLPDIPEKSINGRLQNTDVDTELQIVQDSCKNNGIEEQTDEEAVAYSYQGLPLSTRGILATSLIGYLYYNKAFSFEYTSILLDSLTMKNNTTSYLMEYLSFYTNNCSSFIVDSLPLLYDLYSYFEIENCKSIVLPFQRKVLEILFESLRNKIVLPCMVIPYILTVNNCCFIYKNHLDSSLNCLNDCFYLIITSIRVGIKHLTGNVGYTKKEKESEETVSDSGSNENRMIEEQIETNTKPKQLVNIDILTKFFNIKLPNNFLHALSLYIPLKKVVKMLCYQDDILYVFIVLKLLKPFNKADKQIVIGHIIENNSEEKVFSLVEKSKDFYEKNPKGELPINFIF